MRIVRISLGLAMFLGCISTGGLSKGVCLMVASRRRLTAVFALLFAVAAFPILASAATADFRVLIDNLPDVGCNEGGMTGVDTILVTRAVTTDTSAQETRIYRQVCTAGVFGPLVDLDLTVRPAGLQTPSGLVLLETRIPYSAVPGIETRSIHVGFDATDGFFTQHVLTQPNGSPIMIPPPVGRRHSANTPGSRNFVLDGNGNDWNNIAPLVTGMASDGATAVRMLRVFAVANTTDDFIYFRFDSFVDNSGPFAQDDSFARKSGQGLAVNAPGVLGNDGDPNGKPLTATPVSTPSHGNVVLNPDGSFTYTPDNPTSDTTDKFNYKANNGTKDSNVAEVTIKVSNKNSSAPIANDDAYNTPEDTPLNVAAPGVLANDVDADGPALTATLLTNPSHGSVVLSSNGAFTYNPAHNFFGTDTFTYRVSDGTSNDDAIVTITIGSVNDAPVAQNLSRTTNEEVPVSVTLSATDPEGSALTWQIVSPPTNGVLSGVAPNLTYTPNPNFFGTDTFTYTAKDSSNKVSNTATVTITVNPVNDAPSFSCGPSVIADSSLGAASFPGWATGMSPGPANESSQTLTFEVTANSNPGLFTAGPAVSANGTLTFTPVAGATGTANITLRVRDSGGTANGGVDVSGTCSFTINVDASPTVQSTTPANGAAGVTLNSNVTITFSEPVTVAGTWFSIACATSGTHDTGNSGVSGGATTFTINPTDFTQGESCTATVFASQVTDNDVTDPPNNMAANYVFTFSVDAQPTVTSTTPLNGAFAQPDTDLTVTFSEPVSVTASSFTISCGTSGSHTFALSGGPTTWTLNPNVDFTAGESCTITVLAAQVSDSDTNDPPDNMLANYVFTVGFDAPPSVQSTTPANGATGVPSNSDVTVNFSENVTLSGNWFQIVCGTSGTHDTGNSSIIGGPLSYTINPTDFTQGESCTATIFAADVADNDANDPPDNIVANYVFSFTIDAAPSVTSTTPANGAVNRASNTNITVNFDEPVNANGSAFTISCTVSGAHPFALGGGPSSFSLDPTTDFTNGETCTVTVFAAQVSDNDSNDPPDNMLANFVWTSTTDNPPSVTATTPANAGTTSLDGNVTVTFDEAVNAAASSFTISCTTSGAHTFALSGGPTTFTLDPTTDFTGGETCTVTVVAAQVTDQDAGDPPDNMVSDYVFSFGVDAAPAVTTTTPTNGAPQVAANTNVTINFSESVNASGSSFTISCATSGSHTFTTSASPSTTFTLNPNVDFTFGELCTVTVVAAQVTDTDAFDPPDNMPADYVFSFTVDAAPTVTATTPTNGATNQTSNTNVTVTFSEPVNATGASFTISCATSGAHAFALSGGPTTWTLDPTVDFTAGETCTVTALAAQITDTDAFDPPDNMVGDYVFTFSIDAAPSVTAVTPTNGSTNVATNTNLSVTFSEPVTITNSSVTISCVNTGAHTVTVSGGPTTWTVDPNTDFGNSELCTATVLAAQVTDHDANDPPDNMLANYVFSFSVDAAPTVTSTTPTNGAPQAAANTNITVNFSESVNASGSSFTISCASSGSHTFTTSASPSTTFTLNPNVDFTFGELCTVTVVAAQVTDTDAFDPPDNMPADYVFSFTVDAAPTVTATTPTNAATNQTSNTNVTVTFSEPVNATGASFTISCATSGAHAFALSGGPTTWTLDPNTDFTNGENCTVTVLAAQVTDTDANDPPDNMAANYVFTFTVDTPPSVTTTVPVNGATGVTPSSTITVNFNESVNATTSSFTINCGGAQAFTLSSSPSNTFTLTPTSNLPAVLCTVTVVAAQITDADAGDPPDNMIADFVFSFTVNTPPTANDDVDNAIGNLTLTVPDNDGVLVNGNDGSGADTDPDPGATLAVQGLGPFTGSAGGTITFTAGGGYTYHSEAGDQNVDDVFTYTVVDNNGATDTGQLTIHVGPRYLFVDASFAGSPKDGRDTNPFQTLQQAETGSAANDTFVVKQGAYTDFITLKNGQIMYGNGASATLTTTFNTELFTIFTPTGTHPTFKRSTAGNTITLASGNTLRGIDVSASSGGAAIAGTNFGTLTVSETRIGVGQTNPMPALVLDNGTLAATFQTVNSTAGLNGISLTTCAGNLTVSAGTLTGATGDEFLITGNTPTVNVNFSGNITYAGANSAIRITSTAGTYNGNVTFDTGALNVTGGTAINISAFAAGSTGTHNYYTTSGTATINGAVTGINLGANADGTYTFGPPATPANFAITNTTGTSFLISGNAAKATYRGNITQGNAQTMVGITNHAATGTATLSLGTLNSTAGTGVPLPHAD